MSNADSVTQFKPEIAALWSDVSPRYNVTEEIFSARVQACVKKYAADLDSKERQNFIAQLKAADLCLALACESGYDPAWRDFETIHRSMMMGAARALTKDSEKAEDLTQTVYGDLFGVRETGEQRPGKFAHYSGRGSLGGWLRALIYQTFIDRTRQTSRFEQVEETQEFERLANNSSIKIKIAQPDEALEARETDRLRKATEKAMAQSLASLEMRDQLMLNYYYFDELTLKEIGVLMNAHEATMSRWLVKAQQLVRKKTEEFLRIQGIGSAEINECLGLAARSEIDVRQIISESKGAATERAP